MTVMQPLILGFKLLYQQWNRSLINILGLAFILSITLLTTINTLSNRISVALTEQSNQLIGAPWLISSSRPIDEAWIAKAQTLGLRHSVVTEFLTMVGFQDDSILASIKAIEHPYPLIGNLISTDKTHALPTNASVWIAQEWVDRHQMKIGDTVSVGDLPLKVTGIIEREPDLNINLMNIAPKMIIQRSVLPLTHVIVPGARVEYRLLVDGSAEVLKQYELWIKPQLNENQRIIAADTDRPALNETLVRAQRYLLLASFASIILAATTIFMVMRAFSHDQMTVVALLRTMGTTREQLLLIYVGSLSIIGLLLTLIAVELGDFIQEQLSGYLLKEYHMSLPAKAGADYLLGISTGMIMLLGISLPYLLNLIRTPPILILQDHIPSPKPDIYVLITVIGLSFYSLLASYSQDLFLSAKVMLVIVSTVIFCSLMTALIVQVVYLATPWIKMPYRLGVSRIRHHLNDSIMQIISTTLCLTLLLTLGFIRFELLSEWQSSLPDNTPNHFIYNIIPQDLNPVKAVLDEHHVKSSPFFPVVMARLTAINDIPITEFIFEADERPNYLKRELNNTAMDKPRESDILIKGTWWTENTQNTLVSVESSMAEKLHIGIHDILTFRTGDHYFTASVANIREVEWSNFQPNFFLIFSEYTLQQYPRTFMASFFYEGPDHLIKKALSTASTAATTISVTEILGRVRELVEQSSYFMTILLSVIGLSTLLLLYTIQYAESKGREAEDKIMRVLGASSRQLSYGFLTEIGILSIITALSAFLFTYGICHYLSTALFEFEGQVPISYLLVSFVMAFSIQSLSGIRNFYSYVTTSLVMNKQPH